MLDDVFVMGLAAYLTELLKKRGMPKEWVPVAVLGFAALFNVLNALVFAPGSAWRDALQQGLQWGAMAGGIYGFAQAVKRPSASRQQPPSAGAPAAG